MPLIAALVFLAQPPLPGPSPGSGSSPGAEVEGVVVGPEGEPVSEGRLEVVAPGGATVEITDTDQAGRFRIPSLSAGNYAFRVEAHGYVTRSFSIAVAGPEQALRLGLEAPVADAYRTVVQAARAPLPSQDGTSSSVITREDIENLPGGTTQQFHALIETQPGFIADNYGAVHLRGSFSGLQLRIDGIQIPTAIQDRLQQLLDSQIIQEAKLLIGGLPAEYGADVAGVIDIRTRHPPQAFQGESQTTYGTYNHLEEQLNAAGSAGPFSAIAAAMLQTTERGLDPPAVAPILNDRLGEGRGFLRVDDRISARDKLELLGIYAESHYQIPLDPTIQPLSEGPANALRGVDQYGNSPNSGYWPAASTPTELEREAMAALSYDHDFDDRAQLQIAPFLRFQQSTLLCDVADQLGPAADPGTGCGDADQRVVQGGIQANQTWGLGTNNLKVGLLAYDQRSSVTYTHFTRDDRSPAAGADPARTLSGEDDVATFLFGVYLQDRIVLGKWTFFPGVRFDALRAELQSPLTSKWLLGPSFRLGIAYAFSDAVVLHAYGGRLWQPPAFGAPAAARILGLVAPTAAVPFDLLAEEDNVAEIGLSARVAPQLTLSLTPWVRLSTDTIDDNELGDTALTADYNYRNGRAWGTELAANLVIRKLVRAFANLSYQLSEGQAIASGRYLFTQAQLAFSGYQATDNAQRFTGNLGVDVTDTSATTHVAVLVNCGSGLRTGPTNDATLAPACVVNGTVRHRFELTPDLKPEVALDVMNVFNVVYAYRISTGSLAGTAYAPTREINLRLVLPFGN